MAHGLYVTLTKKKKELLTLAYINDFGFIVCMHLF